MWHPFVQSLRGKLNNTNRNNYRVSKVRRHLSVKPAVAFLLFSNIDCFHNNLECTGVRCLVLCFHTLFDVYVPSPAYMFQLLVMVFLGFLSLSKTFLEQIHQDFCHNLDCLSGYALAIVQSLDVFSNNYF